jgi:hypothetical protein
LFRCVFLNSYTCVVMKVLRSTDLRLWPIGVNKRVKERGGGGHVSALKHAQSSVTQPDDRLLSI